MSWIEDEAKRTIYNYKGNLGGHLSGTLEDLSSKCGKDLIGQYEETFTYEGENFSYSGFNPKESNIMTKIVFEKNGRKAIRVKHTDGKSHVRSMSKENLLRGKGARKTETRYDEKGHAKGRGVEVESVFTKDFKEHTNKIKENNIQQSLKDMKKVIAQSNARSKK